MTDLQAIKKVVAQKNLDPNTATIAAECMVELCQQCGVQKKLAKLGSLFENLTDVVIAFDLDLNVVDSNKLGGYLLKEFKTFYYDGKNYILSELPLLKEVLLTKKGTLNTIELKSFDQHGAKHIFNAGGSPVFSETNVLVGACLIMSDVTEVQKQARQLEDIVSALTHDLKTPLVAAETSLKHLLDGYFGELKKEQKEILYLLNQSNSDALRLVKNLLTVFKYETRSYKLFLEMIEISNLLEKAVNNVKPLLDEKDIVVKLPSTHLQFICDSFEVERVLVNLLTNAIKHTPIKGNIEIKTLKDEDANVVISVEDTGSGIPKEELPNLFERFWQSRKSSTSSNSTGLGLYLSRQIVEAHGGTIWAESEPNKGTKVVFKIPELSNS